MRIDTPLIPDEARRETVVGHRAGKDTSFEKTMQVLERDMWPGARAGKVAAAPSAPSRAPRRDIADAPIDDDAVGGATEQPSHVARAASAASHSSHTEASAMPADIHGAARPGKQAAGDQALVHVAPIPTGETFWPKTTTSSVDDASAGSMRHATAQSSRLGSPSRQHDASDRVSLLPDTGGVSVIARYTGNASERAQMLRTILAELRRHGANVARLTINGVELSNPTTMEEYDER